MNLEQRGKITSLFPTVALLLVLLTVVVDVEPSKPSPMVENLSAGWGPEQVKQYSGYIAVNQVGSAHYAFDTTTYITGL